MTTPKAPAAQAPQSYVPEAGAAAAITFDIEDWHPLAEEWVGARRGAPSGRVGLQVDAIRRILDSARTRATFFCLGETARECPNAIRALAADGHEIASHGFGHKPLHQLTPEEFDKDLAAAEEILGGITGRAPRGYRAPQFSVGSDSFWALGILVRRGYLYDSSIFPMRMRRYGIAGFSDTLCRVSTPEGSIAELPLAVRSAGGTRLPIAGGGYVRILPLGLFLAAARSVLSSRRQTAFYFHPYEFDPARLRLPASPNLPWRAVARRSLFMMHQNLGRRSIPAKLAALLRCADFVPCWELIEQC